MSDAFGYTIFCDDIRHEVGNKISYMGSYFATMNLGADAPAAGASPFLLPKFAAAAHFVIPRQITAAKLRMRLTMERDAEPSVALGEYIVDVPEPPAPDQGDMTIVASHFVLSPLAIPGDCLLRVRGYLDDQEVKAGSLAIRFVPGAPATT